MSERDISVTIAAGFVWTFIFMFAIGVLVTWTIGSIRPLYGLLLAVCCTVVLFRVRGVI